MAVNAALGAINAPAATGSQATTGLGITPDALIFLANIMTAAGNASDAQMSIGFSTGASNQVSSGYNSNDASASSDVVRQVLTNRVVGTYTGGTTVANLNVDMTSHDADGFTLNYNNTINGADISYLGLSGTDILGATAGNFAAATSTGNQAVTGIGFQPNLVLFITNLQTASGVANNNSCFSFGATDGTNQWACGLGLQNAQATMNNRRGFYTNRCIMVPAAGSNVMAHDAAITSMDADGFTVNWQTAPGAAYIVGYLALSVTNAKVGTFNQATTTGNQATTGVGFTPEVLMMASAGHDTANAIVDTARFSIGAGISSSARWAYWTGDEDAAADSRAESRYATDKIVTMADEATGGSPTVLAEADLVSLDSDGFTVNWTTADATARNIGYIAMGGASAPPATSSKLTLLGVG